MAQNNDLINRGKAIKDLRAIKDMLVAAGDPFLASVMNRAIGCIENQPAAKAEEVKHARWDDSGRYHFFGGGIAICCTNCGCALEPEEYKKFHWNYCPVCGAKMGRRTESETD